jgi:hypothetical protein
VIMVVSYRSGLSAQLGARINYESSAIENTGHGPSAPSRRRVVELSSGIDGGDQHTRPVTRQSSGCYAVGPYEERAPATRVSCLKTYAGGRQTSTHPPHDSMLGDDLFGDGIRAAVALELRWQTDEWCGCAAAVPDLEARPSRRARLCRLLLHLLWSRFPGAR